MVHRRRESSWDGFGRETIPYVIHYFLNNLQAPNEEAKSMMNYKLSDNRGIRRFGVNIGCFMLVAVLIMTSAMFDVSTIKASGAGNYPPPSEGDWIITRNTQVSNETITLHGNLIIQNGGSLTLNNVTLFIDQTGTQTLRIEIMPGGSMRVLDNDNDSATTADASVITTSTYYGYLFIADQGSQLELKNSQVSGCGQYSTAGLYTWGIYIATDNTVIENNAIGQTYSGIVIDGGANNYVVNNTIDCGSYGIYLFNAGNNTVSANNVSTYGGNGVGICLYESDENVIENNISNSNDRGVELLSSNYNNVDNNTTNSNTIAGIKLADASYNFVGENTAKFNMYYAGGGIILENASFGNTISGNNLESNSHGIRVATDYIISSLDYNNVLINNELHANTIGIYIFGSNRNLVTENAAWENTIGIFSGSSSHVETNNTIEKKRSFSNGLFRLYSSPQGFLTEF